MLMFNKPYFYVDYCIKIEFVATYKILYVPRSEDKYLLHSSAPTQLYIGFRFCEMNSTDPLSPYASQAK